MIGLKSRQEKNHSGNDDPLTRQARLKKLLAQMVAFNKLQSSARVNFKPTDKIDHSFWESNNWLNKQGLVFAHSQDGQAIINVSHHQQFITTLENLQANHNHPDSQYVLATLAQELTRQVIYLYQFYVDKENDWCDLFLALPAMIQIYEDIGKADAVKTLQQALLASRGGFMLVYIQATRLFLDSPHESKLGPHWWHLTTADAGAFKSCWFQANLIVNGLKDKPGATASPWFHHMLANLISATSTALQVLTDKQFRSYVIHKEFLQDVQRFFTETLATIS